MKLKLSIIILFTALLISAYSTEDNENIRFGAPSGGGKIIVKHGFVLSFDGAMKDPLWVSYFLKKENLPPAGPGRNGVFKQDASLIVSYRTSRGDYPGAYEKCPMAPAADMAYNKKTFEDAFVLSNVCPMSPALKNKKWRELEEAVRSFVKKHGQAWVVTGPVFADGRKKQKRTGRARIAVPSGFYKVVLYQSDDFGFHAAGFYMDNRASNLPLGSYMDSVSDIEAKTGLIFFGAFPPEVSAQIKKKSSGADFFGNK
jgi:endonuclease G